MARTLTAQETEVLKQPTVRVVTRVKVKDASGTPVDYSTLEGFNWISSVEYGEDIDQPVADATVKLFARVHELNLAPLLQASKINNPTGSYAARIDVGRAITIETATLPADPPLAVAESDYRLVFEGEIDEVEWGSDGGSAALELVCRDKGARLQDTFSEKEGRLSDGHPYGANGDGTPGSGTDCETIAQQILNDWVTSPGVTIYTPAGTAGTPIGSDKANWLVTQYKPGKQPVIDSLRILADQIGYSVRYRWSNVTTEMRLEFFQPDRAKTTPDITLEPSQFFAAKTMRLTRNMVRNFIKVWYQTNPNDPETRTSLTRDDSVSISKYGRRYMEISEASDSAINTATEAGKMAEACRDDLKDPKATHEVECPYYFHVQLGDLIRFKANGILFDVDQDLAVTTVRHRLADGQARTTVFCRGKPAGGYITWMKKGQIPGGAATTVDMPPPTPSSATASASIAGLVLRVPDAISPLVDHFEYHVSTTSGFTPGPTTLKAKTRATRSEVAGLTAGTTYYTKILGVRRNGVKSAVSSQLSAVAGYVGDTTIDPTRALVAIAAVDVSRNIDLGASSGWVNKNLDNLADGTTFKRVAGVNSSNQVTDSSIEEFSVGPRKVDSHDTWILDEASTIAYVASPNERVEWSGVRLWKSGVEYGSVVDGNSANGAGPAYVWFDTSISTTALQSGTTQPAPSSTVVLLAVPISGAVQVLSRHGQFVRGEQVDDASTMRLDTLEAGVAARYARVTDVSGAVELGAYGSDSDIGIEISGQGTKGVKLGSRGSLLSISGAWSSFPSSPSTNDVFYRTDLGSLFWWDGSAWRGVSPAAGCAFRAYQSSSQSFGSGSGWTPIRFQTEVFDYGANLAYDATIGTECFVPPANGVYSFAYGLGMDQAANKILDIAVFNGASIVAYGQQIWIGAGGGWRISGSWIGDLTTSAKINIRAVTTDATSRATEAFSYSTWFAGFRVR